MMLRKDYLAFGTPDFSDEEIGAVTRVMRTGWVGMGPETISFEHELADYVGVPEVVSVSSCTSALFLALLAEGVGPGDEVIVPSMTWCATANVALYLGARPVFCDVDQDSISVTPASVIAKLTERTRAVIVVHYGGYAIDVSALREALPAHVAIIEDAAHALGACYPDGSRVGASGNLVCFSFYANKNISTGEGGAIALFDVDKAEHIRRLRMNGLESTAWSRFTAPGKAFVADLTELGYKMNYTDLQAAIGRVQLRRLGTMADKRREISMRYRDRLKAAGLEVKFQSGAFDPQHARHLLVGDFDPAWTGLPRDELLLALRARNVGASIHYRPLHTQPLYRDHGMSALPVTEHLASRIMTLPISARMSVEDVDYVVDHLKELVTKTGAVA